MGTFGTLLIVWVLHAVIAATLAGPAIFFGRKRSRWEFWQLLALIVPFFVWAALRLSPFSIGRHPTNLIEPLFISIAIFIGVLLCVTLGHRANRSSQAVGLLALPCTVAVIAFLVLPLTPASRRGLTNFNLHIVDVHQQRYMMSCIPSSVEMVLKLMHRVPTSYYGLQDAWRNKTDGSFHDFDGKTFEGVTFHQQFQSRGDTFQVSSLFETIDRELRAGRFVIIGLPRGGDIHDWLIYDEDPDGDFLAVSKFGPWTIHKKHLKRTITRMHGTDIGTYLLTPGTAPAQHG